MLATIGDDYATYYQKKHQQQLERESQNVHVTKSGVVIPRWVMYSGVAGIIGYLIRKKTSDALLAGTAGAIIAFAREGKLFPKRKQLAPYMPSPYLTHEEQRFADMFQTMARGDTVSIMWNEEEKHRKASDPSHYLLQCETESMGSKICTLVRIESALGE